MKWFTNLTVTIQSLSHKFIKKIHSRMIHSQIVLHNFSLTQLKLQSVAVLNLSSEFADFNILHTTFVTFLELSEYLFLVF